MYKAYPWFILQHVYSQISQQTQHMQNKKNDMTSALPTQSLSLLDFIIDFVMHLDWDFSI